MFSLKIAQKFAQSQKTLLINHKNFFDFGTIKTFILPDLGEKIKEATIKEWHVKVGDVVEEFQTLADVSTDKLFTQIPSDFNGKISKLYYEEDENALIGKPFVDIEVEDGEYAASENDRQTGESTQAASQQSAAVQSESVNQTQVKREGAALATPYVRGIAKNLGLDINQIVGSGPEGRVLEEDLHKHGKRHSQFSPATRSLAAEYGVEIHDIVGTGRDGLILKSDILDYVKANKIPSKSIETIKEVKKPIQKQQQQKASQVSEKLSTTTVQMDNFAKGMQKSMTASNSIPHLYVQEEIDLTAAKELREQLKKNNHKITFMSLFVKAFSLALNDFPIINSLYSPEKSEFAYEIAQNHNITIAINSPHGLVVPNIKNVQNLNLMQIQQEINDLRVKADKGQLGPKELFEGTVSISNVGVVGGTYASPLLFAPQTSIVAIGRMMEVPKFEGKSVVPKSIVNVSLGCDHRVIDGATAAGFIMRWKFLLENPALMLVQMK